MRLKHTGKLVAAGCVALAPLAAAADTIDLNGVVRDFKRGDWSCGHSDFETAHTVSGHGDYVLVHGLTSMLLGEDSKPVYNPVRPSNDTIESADSLAQWYSDVPGINLSVPLAITLENDQEEPGGVYTYVNNAFWPIDVQLFSNEELSKNFHFTFELHTQFSYTPDQSFTFRGDDKVWVYVAGTKVIDIGGIHSSKSASVLFFDGKAFVDNDKFIDLNLNNGMTEVRS